MTDKKHNDNDLWLDEDIPSPEASQSHRNIHRVVEVDYIDRTEVQVFATDNQEITDKLSVVLA